MPRRPRRPRPGAIAAPEIAVHALSVRLPAALAAVHGPSPAGVPAVAAYAQAHATTLQELDVNPVLVTPQGQGVLAVDAMICLMQGD